MEAETTEVEVVVKQDSEEKVESSPDKTEEKKISGPPSPAPRSITTPTPLVNGDTEPASKKGKFFFSLICTVLAVLCEFMGCYLLLPCLEKFVGVLSTLCICFLYFSSCVPL